jgi:hypothetical protein
MNPIELEWQHIKKDELVGRMFDDEGSLELTVIFLPNQKSKLIRALESCQS